MFTAVYADFTHMYKMFTKHWMKNCKQTSNFWNICFDENIPDCLTSHTFYTFKNNKNLFLIRTLVNKLHFRLTQNTEFPLFIFICGKILIQHRMIMKDQVCGGWSHIWIRFFTKKLKFYNGCNWLWKTRTKTIEIFSHNV